ncbi:hypothetical protein GGI18_001447 [Coemansia linderi]|uniref:Uncharacterized protein n=1 Tax=Coemansia linderi TaxID=2663919 RepID=A0ACC1KKD0_9FUNG|nr:hypothetical protein GGI18_001447 [Coemansia linderi]
MALEIVADALEKLSDTMEPLDLPLPLVGPGYYLEVQVKSPKNAHGSVPFSQINAVTVEGGQAPPVTQVEIILPGESVAHETFMLPVDPMGESVTPTIASDSELSPSVSEDIIPTEIPHTSSSAGGASVLTFSEEDVDEESVTMATAPLPFPPFGGPQHQQEPSPSSESASETVELAALPTLSSGGLMETIDIISASNDNALESSIDAILHSVIQDYKTETIPKAAVGFALIHPRRQAAANVRY